MRSGNDTRPSAAGVDSVRRLMARFALAGVFALLLLTVVLAYASRNVGLAEATADARRVTFVSAKGIVEPILGEDVLQMDRAALDRLDRAVRANVLQGSLIRVKIWQDDGTIAYSDEPRLIGKRFVLGQGERAVLRGAPAEAEETDLSKPENRYETEQRLLEVYQLSHTTKGTPVLFEAYFRYSGVTAVGRRLWVRFAPIAIGSLVVLELVQIPLAWSLARRLRAGQLQRERLLQHALQASDMERRRIASDLHDGVVQELTGVSLSLAAAGRSSPSADPRLGEASASIRESIGSLRSLLVDIYPPNLHEEGLQSALEDLLGRLRNRDIAGSLEFNLGDSVLAPDVVGLLYRGAQEAVRNVIAHAAARRVSISVSVARTRVALRVDDDGRGFSRHEVDARRSDGHFGLTSLAALVAEAGGNMETRSAAGEGTRMQITLPLQRTERS